MPATRSQRTRQALAEILPELLEALSATGDPGAALVWLLTGSCRSSPPEFSSFRCCAPTPACLRLIADILGTAPRLARVLSRRSQIHRCGSRSGIFRRRTDAGNAPARSSSRDWRSAQDYQDYLDRARRLGQEQAFLIGVRVLSGTDWRRSGWRRLRLSGAALSSMPCIGKSNRR